MPIFISSNNAMWLQRPGIAAILEEKKESDREPERNKHSVMFYLMHSQLAIHCNDETMMYIFKLLPLSPKSFMFEQSCMLVFA